MSVNGDLVDLAIRHAVALRRLSEAEARLVARGLADAHAQIVERVIASLSSGMRDRTIGTAAVKSRQFKDMMEGVDRLIKSGYSTTYETARSRLVMTARFEAAWQHRTLKAATEAMSIGVHVAPVERLLSAAVSRPFNGRLLRNWVSDLGASARKDVQRALTAGLTRGDSVEAMARSVRNRLGLRQKQAHALMRTATNHVGAHAREEVFAANPELITGVEFLATLDDRTTLECASLDGKIFPVGEGPRPPIHINCRSMTVPVLASASALGLKDVPAAVRASMDGKAVRGDTYATWLSRQSETVQRDVLGATRADLFRSGKVTIDKFVDKDYSPLTLEQLAKREGLKL